MKIQCGGQGQSQEWFEGQADPSRWLDVGSGRKRKRSQGWFQGVCPEGLEGWSCHYFPQILPFPQPLPGAPGHLSHSSLKRRCASWNVLPAPSTPYFRLSGAKCYPVLCPPAHPQAVTAAQVILGVQVKERHLWLASEFERSLKTISRIWLRGEQKRGDSRRKPTQH